MSESSKKYSFSRPKITFTMDDLEDDAENDVNEAYDKKEEIPEVSKSKASSKKKTFTKAPNLQEIKAMIDTQGLVQKTIDKREAAERQFNTWAEKFGYKSLEKLCEEGIKEDLEFAICAYFDSFTVGKNDELPSKNYIDTVKSHLKVLIKIKTSNILDIADNIVFPKLKLSFKVWY